MCFIKHQYSYFAFVGTPELQKNLLFCFIYIRYSDNSVFSACGKKLPLVVGIIAAVLGVLGVITNLGATFPWLTVGIPAIPSLYFDWFGGCIQAFIFCTLTTLFIKQAAGD